MPLRVYRYFAKYAPMDEGETAVVEKQLLNIKDMCLYLGIGQTKARELVRGQNGFGIRIGNRWYADKRKLDEWVNRNAR